MYLTNECSIGGRQLDGMPEDLSFIVKYGWETPKHMKEAIRVLLAARMAEQEQGMSFSQNDSDGEHQSERNAAEMRLAANPFCSSYVLDYLSKTSSAGVCELIASNPRCAEETMVRLSSHSDANVRAALTENSYCSITILYRLTKDEHPDVRYRLAENSNLPDSILVELSEDENPFVAARAQETLQKLKSGSVIEGKFPRFHTNRRLSVC